MIQYSFSREERRAGGNLDNMAKNFGVEWELVENNYEKSWNQYATRIIDAVSQWCKDCGLKNYATGYSQIAIQITFQDAKDAIYFKLRWHNA